MKTETTKHDKTIFFNGIPSIPGGRIPQLFPKMQLPKIKMGSTKMQTSWSKSVPFMVESLEQTNFDSPLTLADVEFLPTQQTSPKRAKVPLLLCALQVAYFIISCCDLNHLSPPSLSTDGSNYRLQDFFFRCKPVFFLGGGRGGGGKFFLKICKKGNIPFLYLEVYEVTSPTQSDEFCCCTPVNWHISRKFHWLEDDMSWGPGPRPYGTSNPSTRLGKLLEFPFAVFLEEVFQGRHGGLHKGLQRRPPVGPVGWKSS